MAVTNRKEELSRNLDSVRLRIFNAAKRVDRSAEDVALIVVTKTYPISDVEILHELGIRNFAENRDREGREKSAIVSAIWHFQGKLQSNKISSIASWADVVHSLDDPRHLRLLGAAVPESKVLSVFVQVALDAQPGRGGVALQDLSRLAELVFAQPSLSLQGLMAVAPLGENPENAFQRLAQIHSDFRRQFPSSPSLSAGMSGDFERAIENGATHVRIGSSILGNRTQVG
jgi:pyridoxal phosphate enzyme (YggS family)